MKFIHPANEDFIKQGQDYLRFLIEENQHHWPASFGHRLALTLQLWIAGFFFKVGDTDATPLLGALVVADKTALAHPAFADWMNERNLNNHLQITHTPALAQDVIHIVELGLQLGGLNQDALFVDGVVVAIHVTQRIKGLKQGDIFQIQ